MRILITNSQRSVVGGADRYLSDLLPALEARGHHVAFLYETDLGIADRVDAKALSSSAWCSAGPDKRAALDAAEAWGPDVVYAHGVIDTTLWYHLTRSYPTVLFAHNYAGTCATGTKCQARPTPRPCDRRLGPG